MISGEPVKLCLLFIKQVAPKFAAVKAGGEEKCKSSPLPLQ